MREVTLVTGGAGFIGTPLVHSLLDSGHRVVVYDNFTAGSRRSLPCARQLTTVEGDVRDSSRFWRVMSSFRPSRVCHLAAWHFIPVCDGDPRQTWQVNVAGTSAVLHACRMFRPASLLFASTAAVYSPDAGRCREDHPPRALGVYARSKRAGERLVEAFARATGTPTVVARLFNTFGPNDRNPHLIPELIRQIRAGGAVRIGNLDPVRDYVFVDDVVEGLLTLLKAAPDLTAGHNPVVFNLGSGEGHSVRAVLQSVQDLTGLQLTVLSDPSRQRSMDRTALVADILKMTRETGWRPRVTLEAGLRRLLAR